MAHIDVRGPWPILFQGMRATELRGAARDITMREALIWIARNRHVA